MFSFLSLFLSFQADRWLLQPSPYTLTAAEEWIAHTTSPANFVNSGAYDAEKGSRKGEGPLVATQYGIVIAGEACGGIGLEFGTGFPSPVSSLPPSPSLSLTEHVDIYHRTAELGYWLSPSHWGKGHMSALVPAFVQWTWGTFGILVRLNAAVNEANVGSRRVLEKAGFVVEGRRRDAVCKEGRVGAEVMLGALRPRGE